MATPLIKSWISVATPKARNIVRRVLMSNDVPGGLTTQEIYEKAHEKFPEETEAAPPVHALQPWMKGKFGRPAKQMPEPPHRTHPIRSVRYLKMTVLENMALLGEVQKVHISRKGLAPFPKRGGDRDYIWVWKLVDDQPPNLEKGEHIKVSPKSIQFKDVPDIEHKIPEGHYVGFRRTRRGKKALSSIFKST